MAKLKKLEKQIEYEILMFLRSIGVYAWKNPTIGVFNMQRKAYIKPKSVFHIRGASDILGIIDGRFIAIEVKSSSGVLSPEQKTFIEKINERKGLAFCARSIEEAKVILTKEFPDLIKSHSVN